MASAPLPGELRKPLSKEERAKALYRRALAYNMVKEEDAALKDLVAANACLPEDAAIKKELSSTRKLVDAAKAKKRGQMSKMFS